MIKVAVVGVEMTGNHDKHSEGLLHSVMHSAAPHSQTVQCHAHCRVKKKNIHKTSAV